MLRTAHLSTGCTSSLILFLIVSFIFIYVALSSESTSLSKKYFGSLRKMEPLRTVNPFDQKIVHFDLKGAPPKLEYYAELFPMLKRLNVDGVLMEYEDMFPYSGDIAILKRSIAYTRDQIASILSMAKQNDLEVIPLVQTFGHMEFALKYNRFAYLREDQEQIDTICPSESGSWILITEMLRQVRALHPESKRIHIGSDEAWQIAKDQRCLDRLRSELGSSTERLKLSHISRTANFAKHELGFDEVLAWNDMFGETNEQLLLQYKLGELLTPVVWGYSVNVTQPNYFPGGMFERYSKVFDRLMFASAFKGANGKDQKFANADRYLANQLSYVDLYRINETHLIGRLKGIILTGWQRYSHTLPLCEILPVGIPSLVMDIVYLNNTTVAVDELRQLTREFLDCRSPEPEFAPIMLGTESYYPPSDIAYTNCTFPGHQIYDIIERLRFDVWRLHRFVYSNEVKDSILKQLSEFERKLRSSMSPYFYQETVDEFINSTISPLRTLLLV